MLHEAVQVTPREVGGGKGLLVTAHIPKGEVVWWEDQKSEPEWVSVPRCRLYVESLPPEARKKFEHYMYKVGDDAYEALPEYDRLPMDEWRLESDDPSMYMNHSCEPTCVFEPEMLRTEHGAVVMTAFRDLHPGDELTFDYATSEDHEQNWKCLCGAPTCRGRVTGDDWRDPSFQAKYRGHCMPHVEHLIATGGVSTELDELGWVPSAFLTPNEAQNAPEAFWTTEESRARAAELASRIPLVLRRSHALGKHLVYAGDDHGETSMLPIPAGETVMLLPPNVLKRASQMKGAASYNACLQVRPAGQRPGALFSLSETAEDMDNFLNHSCDPNCDVSVFPTNYLIKLTANRDIMPGEAVTIDYDATEEDLVAQGGAFDCACGASNCRGRVVGWKHRAPIDINPKTPSPPASVVEMETEETLVTAVAA